VNLARRVHLPPEQRRLTPVVNGTTSLLQRPRFSCTTTGVTSALRRMSVRSQHKGRDGVGRTSAKAKKTETFRERYGLATSVPGVSAHSREWKGGRRRRSVVGSRSATPSISARGGRIGAHLFSVLGSRRSTTDCASEHKLE
jgi:hypothetical protein